MSGLTTDKLHGTFIEAFGGDCVAESSLKEKPVLARLALPYPTAIRLYAYNLVGGVGTVRDFEYKAVLRLRNHPVGARRWFDHGGGRLAVLAAYRLDLDVWVLWDASLNAGFTNGYNIQIRADTVMTAAAVGAASQIRRLTSGTREIVLACTTANLPATIHKRVETTGGVP